MKTSPAIQPDTEIRYLRFLNNTLQIGKLRKDVCDEFTRKIFDYLEGEPLFDAQVFSAFIYYLIFQCKQIQPAICRDRNPIDTLRFAYFKNDLIRLFNSLSPTFTLEPINPNQFHSVSIREKLKHLLVGDEPPHKGARVEITLPENNGMNKVVPFVSLDFKLPRLSVEQNLDIIHFTICALNYLSQNDNPLEHFQNAENSQKSESFKITSNELTSIRNSVIKNAFREKEVWEDESEFDESLPDIKRILQAQNQDPKIERLWLDKSSPVFVKAESEAIELEAKAKKHKDLTIDRAILLMKHLAPRLTGCDKNKVADVISFLTGFDSEAIRQGFSEIKNKFANKPNAYNKDVKIVCEYLNLIGLTNEAEKLKRDSGVT
jgi:hypothetical protein